MSSDIVRLPGGKVITRSRAVALGMLDEAGNLKADAAPDSAAAKVLRDDKRAADWAKRQGLQAPAAKATKAPDDDIPMTRDGIIRMPRNIEPARPQNVDKTGEPVTDPDVLAAIAAETAAIDQAKVEGVAQTPAQKRLATMAANKAAKEAIKAAAAEDDA